MITSSTIPPSRLLNGHFKYFVFNLLNLKPLASIVSLHYSNLLLTPFLVELIYNHNKKKRASVLTLDVI